MSRIWQFRKSIYHEVNQGRFAKYKIEELSRRVDNIRAMHSDSQGRLLEFQRTHINERDKTNNFRYDSQRCLASLAEMYLKEAECPPLPEQNALARYLEARSGVG
jgi:hypothetical protein